MDINSDDVQAILTFDIYILIPAPSRPQNLAHKFSDDSATVTFSWDAPYDVNGILREYNIQCFCDDDIIFNETLPYNNASRQEYAYTGLPADKSCFFQVKVSC